MYVLTCLRCCYYIAAYRLYADLNKDSILRWPSPSPAKMDSSRTRVLQDCKTVMGCYVAPIVRRSILIMCGYRTDEQTDR